MGPGLFSPDDWSTLVNSIEVDSASMGPGLFSPDDFSSSSFLTAARFWLQWGRAYSARMTVFSGNNRQE